MKYAVQQCVNGNFSTVAEFEDNLQGALVKFHQTAANLWNAPDVLRAHLRIVDENQNTVMGKSEDIGHDAPVEPVAPEEPTEDDDENEPA